MTKVCFAEKLWWSGGAGALKAARLPSREAQLPGRLCMPSPYPTYSFPTAYKKIYNFHSRKVSVIIAYILSINPLMKNKPSFFLSLVAGILYGFLFRKSEQYDELLRRKNSPETAGKALCVTSNHRQQAAKLVVKRHTKAADVSALGGS